MMLAILIATILVSGWLNYVVVGAAVLTLAGTMYRTRGYIKGNQLKGQLEAKDEVIHTNAQVIESFRARVEALEEDFQRVGQEARVAQGEVSRLRQELKTLERYAAPEAVDRFQGALDSHRTELMNRLKVLEVKIDALQQRAN